MSYNDHDLDYNMLIARPLYFGLGVNVVLPAALIFLCYYIDQHGGVSNKVGDSYQLLFYFFCVLAAAEAGLALWWRQKLMAKPVVRSKETFAFDIADGLVRISRPVFLVIAGISLYGVAFYFLTGHFKESVILVLISFIIFQLVRPRHGQVKKFVETQRKLVDQGQFLAG